MVDFYKIPINVALGVVAATIATAMVTSLLVPKRG
jgi:hypothetical protein